MTEQRSPWARPPAGSQDPAGEIAYPRATPPTAPLTAPLGHRAGIVTRSAPMTPTTPPAIQPETPPDPARRNRRMMWWFGGTALAVVALGVVVVLAMVMTGGGSPFGRRLAGPSDTRPDLAKLCPPPSQDASGAPAPPPPPGPRTVDSDSGISYAAYGAPWQPWRDIWTKGTLHVSYQTGQYFVTESYTDQDGFRSDYLASILSGSVPAANNDALSLDLQCTGRQVAADVRAEYYPQPNTADVLRDELTTLGGRPAWITTFRMHFHRAGLKATDELVGLALIDVGRPRAAVLYVSIPGTHHDYDGVVDNVLSSVRPVG